jgi:hypothetical protein
MNTYVVSTTPVPAGPSSDTKGGVYIPPQFVQTPEKEAEILVLPEAEKDEEIVVEAAKPVETPKIFVPHVSSTATEPSSSSIDKPTESKLVDQICDKLFDALEFEDEDLSVLAPLLSTIDAPTRTQVTARVDEMYEIDLCLKTKQLVNSRKVYASFAFLTMPQHMAEAYILSLLRRGEINDYGGWLFWAMLLGRSQEELAPIVEEYKKLSQKDCFDIKDFDNTILGNTVLHLLSTATHLPRTEYDSSVHTLEKAKNDAELIYKKGSGRNKLRFPGIGGKAQKEIVEVLASAPPEHLRNIDAVYTKKYGTSLMKCIEKIFNMGCGDLQRATLYYIQKALYPYEAIASLFHFYLTCFLSPSRDHPYLVWLIICHQNDLAEVEKAYQSKYETDLTLFELIVQAFNNNLEDEEKAQAKKDAYLALLLAVMKQGSPELDALNYIFLTEQKNKSRSRGEGDDNEGGLIGELLGEATDAVVGGVIDLIFD